MQYSCSISVNTPTSVCTHDTAVNTCVIVVWLADVSRLEFYTMYVFTSAHKQNVYLNDADY